MKRLAVAALLLAACASRGALRTESPPDRPPTIEELEEALSDADCTKMGQLRDTICEAAKRLCEIADEAKCGDAKARCERAKARVERSCMSGAVNAK